MNTGWTIAAMVAAVAFAGPVRAWIVAFSVPEGQPPATACATCQSTIIPARGGGALGWLSPHGRCRACRVRIGPPPWTVEAVLAVTAGALVHAATVPLTAPLLVCLTVLGVTLAFVDLAVCRLPDRFTAAAFLTAVVVVVVQTAAGGDWALGLRAAIAAALTGGFYLLLTLMANGGYADAKLGLTTGLLLGAHSWAALIVGGFVSVLITAVLGATLRAAGRRKPGDDLAHGPSMLAGVLLVVAIAPFAPHINVTM
ncbi:prepilin peptidase [Actinoplanes sp. NPDC049316]|uniref:prepilin peptidase n=1 Tax=Actinoplanes sp. NPDC049316 TaxID=3154727 RepID=UPI00343AB2C5